MTDFQSGDFPTGAKPDTYATSDVAAVGGQIKTRPDDFLVEEIPAYEPCGEGEHLYLFIEKRGLSTMQAVEIVARHFGVQRRDIGYAGLKDKKAITRQLLSVWLPGKDESAVGPLEHEQLIVLWSDRHGNKLRRGHLVGNRFVIRIRQTDVSRTVQAHTVLSRLEAGGVPNRIGPQRFGFLANNHLVGRALLRGDYQDALDHLLGPCATRPPSQSESADHYAAGRFVEALETLPKSLRAERAALRAVARGAEPQRAILSIGGMERSFYITAFQSAVFNAVLDRRLKDDSVHSLMEGDLAFKHGNGAVFAVDAATAADPLTAERLTSLEISPSGPMHGLDMPLCTGVPGEIEAEALASAGVSLEQFAKHGSVRGQDASGKRRPLRIWIRNIDVEGGVDEHGGYIRCAFDLPRGSFATNVMEEVMKVAETPEVTIPTDRQPIEQEP